MVAMDAAAHWQRFYDQRAAQSSPGDFMRVLGYHPGEGLSYEALFANLLAEIRQRLRLAPQHRLLDIACGFGVFTRALAREAAFTVGTDLAGMLLRKGRELELPPLSGLAQARAQQQPFRDGSFDRILCFGMFFHLEPESARQVVAEVLRLLRPGGRALIGDVLHPRRIQFERSYIWRVPALLALTGTAVLAYTVWPGYLAGNTWAIPLWAHLLEYVVVVVVGLWSLRAWWSPFFFRLATKPQLLAKS